MTRTFVRSGRGTTGSATRLLRDVFRGPTRQVWVRRLAGWAAARVVVLTGTGSQRQERHPRPQRARLRSPLGQDRCGRSDRAARGCLAHQEGPGPPPPQRGSGHSGRSKDDPARTTRARSATITDSMPAERRRGLAAISLITLVVALMLGLWPDLDTYAPRILAATGVQFRYLSLVATHLRQH
jgi:hypothetical protein